MIDEGKRDEVASWLRKAMNDLRAAKRLAEGPSSIPDVAVYHCQQAAEKALKGYLVAHDIRIMKTHNLKSLIEQAAIIEPGFDAWEDAAIRLTPFAFLYRYPGVDEEPDEATVGEAIEDAETILNQVVAFLPDGLKPGVSDEV